MGDGVMYNIEGYISRLLGQDHSWNLKDPFLLLFRIESDPLYGLPIVIATSVCQTNISRGAAVSQATLH
jgi:hypothetical protein